MALFLCRLPAPALSSQLVAASEDQTVQATGPDKTSSEGAAQQAPGSITGTVVDRTGAVVVGARITLTRDDQPLKPEALSDSAGQFVFKDVPPGPFRLTVQFEGFATQVFSGNLGSGESYTIPEIELEVASAVTEVQVGLSPVEVAEEEIHEQEKQRVLGVLPNFYVTYAPHPAPLIARQKFALAWKMIIDPATFGVVGLIAGAQQAQNSFSDYGQGAAGFAKRYGASYADLVSGTIIGAAILPSLLKQDPRYFYKGSGTRQSRVLYALANSVVCKGDNGRWQPNYSNMLGSLAAGGISNLYYPASDRNGARLTFENAAIGIGATGLVNVLQEFVIPKVTHGAPKPDPPKP